MKLAARYRAVPRLATAILFAVATLSVGACAPRSEPVADRSVDCWLLSKEELAVVKQQGRCLDAFADSEAPLPKKKP